MNAHASGRNRWSWKAGIVALGLVAAVSSGCGDDADGSTGSGTGSPDPTTPQNWDDVQIEVEGEAAQPGNCVIRELTVRRDGRWIAELCRDTDGDDDDDDLTPGGDPDKVTGQLTQEELNAIDEAVQPILPDLGSRQCERVTGFSNVEVQLTVDRDDVSVVDVEEDEGEVCYRGGIDDAKALRDVLIQTRNALEASIGSSP